MYIKLLISYCIIFSIVACNNENQKQFTIDKVANKMYKYDDCLAHGSILGADISSEKANKLMSFITPEGILNAYKNNDFWFDVVTGRGLLEYYFFYDSECDKRIENTKAIINKYFLGNSEFSDLKVDVKAINERDLPKDLSRPVGRWVDK